jgi:hypothetical protein
MTKKTSTLDMLKNMKSSPLAHWLSLMMISIGLVSFAWVAVQQDYRMTANDPQIQIAEDGATSLNHGASPVSLVATQKTDMAASVAPFVIVVDKNMNVLASGAQLNGQTVLPPSGVFSDAAAKGELRFTWQTEGGYRFATVVDPSSNGDFVVSARSLREVEAREDKLSYMAAATLVGLFIATLLITLVVR